MARNYSREQDSTEEKVETPLIVALAASASASKNWYVDSRASHHMTRIEEWFEIIKPYDLNKFVELGNNYPLHIKGIGQIAIKIDGKIQRIGNVLFVLGMKKNLMSVSQLSEKKTENNI